MRCRNIAGKQCDPTVLLCVCKGGTDMKFLKKTALVLCFLLIAAGTCYGVIRYLKQDKENGPKKNSTTDATPSATATPTSSEPQPTPSVILKRTDPVRVDSISDVVISALAEKVLPSVVQINSKVSVRDYWGRTQTGTSQGSGIILDSENGILYIATNHHVIENASFITVIFPDNSEIEARLLGSDAAGDLAILTVDTDILSDETLASCRVAALATETSTEVGDMVVALGNALGYGTSVTVGYVSALDREVSGDYGVFRLIQTDAAINPGNSGGALVNMKGEVIGINSMKYAESYSRIEGMGFAIPITQALPVLNELKKQKSFPAEEAGYLGVYITAVTSEMQQTFGWPRGVYVSSVLENSAASAAGIISGDIILSVNGIHVYDTEQLISRVTSYQAGTEISLVISRENDSGRSEITLPVTLMVRTDIHE